MLCLCRGQTLSKLHSLKHSLEGGGDQGGPCMAEESESLITKSLYTLKSGRWAD